MIFKQYKCEKFQVFKSFLNRHYVVWRSAAKNFPFEDRLKTVFKSFSDNVHIVFKSIANNFRFSKGIKTV